MQAANINSHSLASNTLLKDCYFNRVAYLTVQGVLPIGWRHDLLHKAVISVTGIVYRQFVKFVLERLLDLAVSAVTQKVDDWFIFAMSLALSYRGIKRVFHQSLGQLLEMPIFVSDKASIC